MNPRLAALIARRKAFLEMTGSGWNNAALCALFGFPPGSLNNDDILEMAAFDAQHIAAGVVPLLERCVEALNKVRSFGSGGTDDDGISVLWFTEEALKLVEKPQ